jgi:hypothetical protein
MSPSTTKPTTTSLDRRLRHLEERHHTLLRDLDSIGIVLRGTIGKRMMRCGKPTCSCRADPPALHGPYYLWTRKVAAKTVTVRLTADQAAALQRWTRNMRRLDRLVRKLQELGLRAADAVAGSS